MKQSFIIFIIIFCFFSCKIIKKEIFERDIPIEKTNILSSDLFFHNCWVFQPGDYYLISDTIIYDQPNINSSIIGYLNIHDKISVVEDAHEQEIIDDVTSCWYYIKHNNLKGFIFGGNIAKRTFIYDIDKNGIVDYFQYRISFAASNYHFDTRKDIMIYINDKQIITEKLFFENEYEDRVYFFNTCSFEKNDDLVLITLSGTGPISVENYIFSINKDGEINFLRYEKIGQFFEDGEWINYE